MSLRELMPHQHDALAYASKRKAIALYMEMRLGKTAVAIRWVSQLPLQRKKILVVAPLAVLASWKEELIKEAVPPSAIHHIKGPKPSRITTANEANSGFFLTNYEAVRVTPELQGAGFNVLICDESTRIRNPQAGITRILVQKYFFTAYKAILSGLPAPESPLDYYSQFQFLHGKFMGAHNYWQFRNSYFKLYGYDWLPKPSILGRIKEEVHTHAFVCTRKQVHIGSKKIYEKRTVPLTSQQKKLYKQVEKDFAVTVGDVTLETKWNPVKLSWLRRLAGGFTPPSDGVPMQMISNAKNEELLLLLSKELKEEQVVIWYCFNEELHHTIKFLASKGIKARGITGEVPLDVRNEYIREFKVRDVRVLCVQVKCGKFGVDWSCASTAIYYSNSYEAEERAQSEDRIVHPKKTEPLLYIDLVTEKTVDEDVVEILKDKTVTSQFFMTKFIRSWKEHYAYPSMGDSGNSGNNTFSVKLAKRGAVR